MTVRPDPATSDASPSLEASETSLAALRAEIERLEAAVAAERRTLERELAIARRIQLSLMPSVAPVRPGWEFATGYRAARSIGGDFYDLYGLGPEPDAPDAPVGLAIADVTGKGVTAALLMAFSRAVLRSAAYNADGPLDALRRTNGVLATDVQAGLFLTALVGRLDPAGGRLRYASAGHEPPVLIRAGSASALPAGGSMLGLFPNMGADSEAAEHLIHLEAGDVLVWHTDGVTDARDATGDRFGEERLHATLERWTTDRSPAGRSAEGVVSAIFEAIDSFVGGEPQADDVTLVVIRRSP